MLDEFGGLVGVLDVATVAEKVAVYRAARLGIMFYPHRHAVALRVDLSAGVSVRVGGAMGTLTPPLLVEAERELPAA